MLLEQTANKTLSAWTGIILMPQKRENIKHNFNTHMHTDFYRDKAAAYYNELHINNLYVHSMNI